jgi:hypothetical protein
LAGRLYEVQPGRSRGRSSRWKLLCRQQRKLQIDGAAVGAVVEVAASVGATGAVERRP